MTQILKICPMPHFFRGKLELPRYQTSGSVGMDVRACFEDPTTTMTLYPWERKAIPTGLKVGIPEGYELQVRPRSGMSLKTSLLMVNSPGTIDQAYRGETHIIMGNFGTEPYVVHHGDRIAQWVMAPIIKPQLQIVEDLETTLRGSGGFGSTGGYRKNSDAKTSSRDSNLFPSLL